MSRRFHVGQKVVIVRASQAPELRGTVTTIVEDLHPARVQGRIQWVYSIDIRAPNGGWYGAFPEDLRPWYDGDQPGSWDALRELWQPRGIEA